ncbi:hypothetical protein [Nitrosomonas sp. Is37]|uniref:hypothetical protein n=1 Tax=Nitrosomonas sp. Is37 TaxID=3080535 RepID=UPI00294B4F6C|nr:hypothetical protein [Nitrosomonas sp. Is37]MDV6344644.1 hypothetical protein [Nitrosomonas sp. Is37]
MKTVNILFVLLFTYSFLCMAQSGVYKHVNQDGHTFYSDTEMKGASEIDLSEITVLPAGRYVPASLAIKKGATPPEHNEVVEKKIDQEIAQTPMPEIARQNSSDKNVNQLNDYGRVQQVIEEMALYEDSIEVLEIELYNLGVAIKERMKE